VRRVKIVIKETAQMGQMIGKRMEKGLGRTETVIKTCKVVEMGKCGNKIGRLK
jgi:hypothetical protein